MYIASYIQHYLSFIFLLKIYNHGLIKLSILKNNNFIYKEKNMNFAYKEHILNNLILQTKL